MEVAYRGGHFCVLGEWRKGMPETMAELAKMMKMHKSRKVPSREGAPGGLNRASGFPFPL